MTFTVKGMSRAFQVYRWSTERSAEQSTALAIREPIALEAAQSCPHLPIARGQGELVERVQHGRIAGRLMCISGDLCSVRAWITDALHLYFVRPDPIFMPMHDDGPNPLIRLFLNSTAVGFALSAVFVAILWLADVMDIASHGAGSKDAFLLLFILWFFNGLLFGCVQISYVVWQMGRSDD